MYVGMIYCYNNKIKRNAGSSEHLQTSVASMSCVLLLLLSTYTRGVFSISKMYWQGACYSITLHALTMLEFN